MKAWLGRVSSSAGISCVPEKGLDFNALYVKADQALYYLKNHQKGAFAFYLQLWAMFTVFMITAYFLSGCRLASA